MRFISVIALASFALGTAESVGQSNSEPHLFKRKSSKKKSKSKKGKHSRKDAYIVDVALPPAYVEIQDPIVKYDEIKAPVIEQVDIKAPTVTYAEIKASEIERGETTASEPSPTAVASSTTTSSTTETTLLTPTESADSTNSKFIASLYSSSNSHNLGIAQIIIMAFL